MWKKWLSTTFENYADVSINNIQNSSRKSRINLKFSTETHNNDLQNMLNDQLYKFYNLEFWWRHMKTIYILTYNKYYCLLIILRQ